MSSERRLLLFLLLTLNILIWLAIATYPPKKLKLIACDVGQGDAIMATYGTFQILTDGGLPNGKVINCLSKYMPFWDREVEVVVNTHPQLDHYGGLIEVLDRYKVKYFIGNGLDSGASSYSVLKKEVGSKGVTVLNPLEGLDIRYGLILYDIFWPSQEFLKENFPDTALNNLNNSKTNVLGAYTSKKDPNVLSVVAKLSYGDFDALLTGDIDSGMVDKVLVELEKEKLTIEYLKVPHHGSKNGMNKEFLDYLQPKIAVISVGQDNSYGHPNKEILDMLNEDYVKIERTDLEGDIVVTTDGNVYEVK